MSIFNVPVIGALLLPQLPACPGHMNKLPSFFETQGIVAGDAQPSQKAVGNVYILPQFQHSPVTRVMSGCDGLPSYNKKVAYPMIRM